MKAIKPIGQFGIIMLFFYVGQYISKLIAPWMVIPGSIIGMLLLFIALLIGVIKLGHVEDVSHFFLKNMGFFFIPLGVSLIDSYVDIKPILWQVTLLLVISNILVMGITARVVEWVMLRRSSGQEVKE
jgi:holin-like protein